MMSFNDTTRLDSARILLIYVCVCERVVLQRSMHAVAFVSE